MRYRANWELAAILSAATALTWFGAVREVCVAGVCACCACLRDGLADSLTSLPGARLNRLSFYIGCGNFLFAVIFIVMALVAFWMGLFRT